MTREKGSLIHEKKIAQKLFQDCRRSRNLEGDVLTRMPLFLSERSLLDKPVFLGKTFDEFANGGSGDIELPGGSADFLVSICVEEAEYSCDERVSEDRKRTDPARQKRMIWMRACFAWTTKDRDP